MALTSDGMDTTMLVSPNGNGGFGDGLGNGGWWFILLLVLLGAGNGFGGFGGGGGYQQGFDQAAVMGGINGLNASVNSGFSNAEVAACNRAMDAMQTAYNNQIASMNQNFANQQALNAQLAGMQAAQADCCCQNRIATIETQNMVQNEANATRAAGTANTQMIMDKLCQLELDGVRSQLDTERRENENLRTQLQMANLAASQTAQTAQILADNAGQTAAIRQMVNPQIVPSFNVAPPYNFGQSGYGCGCGVA